MEDRLFIGVNYHPHDWSPERWREDIALMVKAGFDTVRLGHLAWDSFEPDDGVYTFAWFDEVLDLFAHSGIGVVLDVSVRPAPVWVHAICPGCDIHDTAGNPSAAVRRYMEDVSDPAYQNYAMRYARVFLEHYRSHPAIRAFGLCNEQGAGFISYSQGARERFQKWLRNKYGSIDALNQAWATQRWSRRLRSFEDVVLPQTSVACGAPEAWLDMRRFYSDGIGQFVTALARQIEELAPGIPHSSNHYSGHEKLGFDLMKYADSFVDYPGVGHYPDYVMNEQVQYTFTTIQERLGEQDKPMWFLEFISGANGIFAGPAGYVRMQAFLCLQHRLQMLLGWTWRTMLAGEEQFYNGLLCHDGIPGPLYAEYAHIARDFRKLEKHGFPYVPEPEIAVAFNQDSMWCAQYSPRHFAMPYPRAVIQAQQALFHLNRDYNMVSLEHLKKNYKILILPEHIVMSPNCAQTVRSFVASGGTAIMTGYSATLDEHGKVFESTRPGLLSDVFGIRVAGFDRAGQPDTKGWIQDSKRTITRETDTVRVTVDYVERLELQGASCFATLENGQCAVSMHIYGKGKAIYLAPEANSDLLEWLIQVLAPSVGLKKIKLVPKGVQMRQIRPGAFFYVNTTNLPLTVELDTPAYGVLAERMFEGKLSLAPYDGELLIEK